MPILAAAAVSASVDPKLLMVPAALSASCAFMLPRCDGTQCHRVWVRGAHDASHGFGRVCLKLYWCSGVDRLIGMVVGIMQRRMYIVVKRVAQIAFTMGLLMSVRPHMCAGTRPLIRLTRQKNMCIPSIKCSLRRVLLCVCLCGKSILPKRCSYTHLVVPLCARVALR